MKGEFILGSLLFLCMSLHAYEGNRSSVVQSTHMQQSERLTYNTPARIDNDHSWDVAVSASYIYWYAGQDMMDFARNNPDIPLGQALQFPVINGGTIYFDFHYKSGFKVSLGSNLPIDDWTWLVEYTRLNFSENGAASTNGSLLNHWLVAGNRTTTIAMNGFWYLNFNTIDLKLSRPFYSGEYLVLSPHFGMRGGIINQTFWVKSRIVDTLATVPAAIHPVSDHRSDSWLIGPRGGVHSEWKLGGGLSLTGAFAAAICYQDFTARMSEDSIRVPGTLAIDNYTNKYSLAVPNADCGLGFSWGSYFHNHRWHFLLSALYEFNVFWYQNAMRDLKDEITNQDSGIGNLYLHGLTAKAQFDF